jgi:DNA mismatch repair protein MutS2
MHPGALRALEFDRIVEAVCRLATTPLAAERLRALRPLTDPRAVATALAATSEGVAYLGEHGDFPLAAPSSLDGILTTLAIEGRLLEPATLVEFGRFLTSVDATRAAVRRAGRQLPQLSALVEATASFEREVADIRRKIDETGEVADDASPELRIIRDRLRKQRTRLRGTLESFLRSRETAKYLQDQIVTDRNGRYVLVVRSEHRTAIPGIVHGTSSSGASLYLEPLSTVEINNEVVALEQQEGDEVRRILLGLTDAFRRRAAELTRTVESAVELDVIQAKARFSGLTDGVEPALASDGRLEFRAARHPLLVPAVRALIAAGEPDAAPATPPVPVDLVLVPPTRVLVITGPNTGGKTVALKSAGLLALMAQAGLHVPAAGGSQITVLRSVFADIGDEQSIAASLSTFSGHMTNVAAMDRAFAPPALVLLDEVGAGTDPIEGGALGLAIVDYFRQRGALVVATTHYDSLKSYASTTEGVACAAFGFDPEHFTPTYKLNYGSPGRSLALEVAARLGVPEPIIEAARARRSAREAQLADHLAKMDHELGALEHERRLATRERETLADETARLHARDEELKRREEAFKKRLDDRLEQQIREARREIDAVVDALKAQTARLAEEARRAGAAAPAIPTGETGGARTAARAALDGVERKVRERTGLADPAAVPAAVADEAAPTSSRPPAVGARVLVGGLGMEGVVRLVHEHEAEVEVRGKRLRVQVDELRTIGGAAAPRAAVNVSVQLQPRDGVSTELNVIGCTVDEALSRAERFLDEALVTEQRTLRVIHGFGTGQLRRAIGAFLRSHPLVAAFGPAPDGKGGGGVTLVELKE